MIHQCSQFSSALRDFNAQHSTIHVHSQDKANDSFKFCSRTLFDLLEVLQLGNTFGTHMAHDLSKSELRPCDILDILLPYSERKVLVL